LSRTVNITQLVLFCEDLTAYVQTMHKLNLFDVTTKFGIAAVFFICCLTNSESFRKVRVFFFRQPDEFIKLHVLFTVNKRKLKYVSSNMLFCILATK